MKIKILSFYFNINLIVCYTKEKPTFLISFIKIYSKKGLKK